MTQQQKNNLLQTTVSMILMGGTGIVMLSSQVPFIRRVSEYSVHIILKRTPKQKSMSPISTLVI